MHMNTNMSANASGAVEGFAAAGEADTGVFVSASAAARDAGELALLVAADPACVVLRWRSELGEEHAFTAAELDRWSEKVANLLATQGVAAGDAVVLALGDAYQRWFAELALAKLGAVAVELPTDADEAAAARVLAASGACAVVATNRGSVVDVLDHVSYLCPSVTARLIVNADGAPALFAGPAEQDETCVPPAWDADGLPHGAALSGLVGVCALGCVRPGWLDFNTYARVAPALCPAVASANSAGVTVPVGTSEADTRTGATLEAAGRAA